MSKKVIFLLDNDKTFLDLYTKLLQTKGWQVFATDNLFLLIKYAQTTTPEWIFIDQNYTQNREKEIINIINKGIPFNQINYAVMSPYISSKNIPTRNHVEFVYKPHILEKIKQITENCCNHS